MNGLVLKNGKRIRGRISKEKVSSVFLPEKNHAAILGHDKIQKLVDDTKQHLKITSYSGRGHFKEDFSRWLEEHRKNVMSLSTKQVKRVQTFHARLPATMTCDCCVP